MDWSKATFKQLYVIIHYEQCPACYKRRARDEIKRRLGGKTYETKIIKRFGDHQLFDTRGVGSLSESATAKAVRS
ncbi:hypothetical protein B6A27_00260 [Anoxybacillus sp. UARK-01]|uniref:hypothetical protein n=1 Tax=Anoxybacillus sp. UARK-01 TaxID=1895648 RepID=UPI0009BBDC01|nr:hypothetical protein [Anoxybacillus sp. UARK-01]OQM47513.1 hypothetical protein B6A27_00260 [Anoxybacillus sp. UARK-01]